MIHPMATALRDGTFIVILTDHAAHRAQWDGDYDNFWSTTADRVVTGEACLGWMYEDEWRAFVTQRWAK